ncbi:SDR family oxidoreductase [Pelagibius sp. CAU 1746]|uniref:SDR family NAD(P)-dependent oxidoreductase n=1 Tax=Pelagibius sp. CAU 1746 TaxID=3140370 RepID=UPI00325ACE25
MAGGPGLFDLSGRVALVTGGSSGIGRRLGEALAGAGASVVLVARRAPQLSEAVASIKAAGGRAAGLARDLADPAEMEEVARLAAGDFGPPDILVNAAGINLREAPEAITPESWERTITLNLTIPFFLARACVAGMKDKSDGRIINIASLQSERAMPNGMAYGASKGGVAQLTRAMAEAWSGAGVTANAIAPGFFPTALTGAVFEDEERVAALAAQTAIGRNGRLEDLDGIAIFLASAASAYITGQVIYVDGGFTAK